MNTNRSLIVAVSAATVLCAALVWSNAATASRARELKAQLEAKETELQKLAASKHNPTTQRDTGLADLLAQRDAEYTKLREEYDQLKQELTNAAPADAASAAPPPNGRGQRGGNNAWLERLRLQDPERYKQMMEAREQRRQRAQQQYQEQMAQLDNRIQTAPTQEEVDLATQIADSLDRLGQLREQMQALRDLPEDQRQAQAQDLRAQVRDTFDQLSQLREQDRTLQYTQLAEQLGLKGQDAQILVKSIPQILDSTRYTPQGGAGGFGGPGGDRGGNRGNTGGSSAGSTSSSQSSSSTAQ